MEIPEKYKGDVFIIDGCYVLDGSPFTHQHPYIAIFSDGITSSEEYQEKMIDILSEHGFKKEVDLDNTWSRWIMNNKTIDYLLVSYTMLVTSNDADILMMLKLSI